MAVPTNKKVDTNQRNHEERFRSGERVIEMEKKKGISVSVDYGWIAFVIFLIAFVGEPDLVDALIHFLMK